MKFKPFLSAVLAVALSCIAVAAHAVVEAPQTIARSVKSFAVDYAAPRLMAALTRHMMTSGLILRAGQFIPNSADFQSGRVTNPANSEVIRQRLYDFQLYPNAGVAQLSFFSQPQGQGVTTAQGAVVGSGKTKFDTNITQANTLPSGLQYIIETIEISFLPGSVATANTYTPAAMSLFAAVAAAAVAGQLSDVNIFWQSGLLEFTVLQKLYLQEVTAAFPTKTHLVNRSAVANTSATTGEIATAHAYNDGRPYILNPNITLQPAVNFSLNLVYPAAVGMPSGFNGRVGVIFDGYMQRAGQ